MKVGILATLVLVLVAIYFVFGSDFLSPSNSAARSDKGEVVRGADDAPLATVPTRSGTDHRAGATDEPGANIDKAPSSDPASDPEAVLGAPGSNANVHRTPGGAVTYTRHDGVVVRDHRANPTPPNLDAYVDLPREVSKVQSPTLMAVQMALRPEVTKCLESHSEGAAPDAKMQILLMTSISSETLKVDQARVTISGLAAEEPLRSCVEGVVIGHEQAVAGHEDVVLHRMVFKYVL